MAEVFISYKSEEFDQANWVKQTLENNGISCWMAPMCINGGSSYAVEIPKAIRECKVFVLLLSEKAQKSKWVPREIDQAINENKIIMPFALENCSLKDDFNFYLTNVQRYEAYENKSIAIEKMINEIRAVLGTDSREKSDVSPAPIPSSKPEFKPSVSKNTNIKQLIEGKSKNKLIVAAAIIVAVIALIVVLAIVLSGNGSSNADADNNTSAVSSQEPEKIVMSDNLLDFTFNLEGVVYKLPCKYEDLTNNGWTISSSGYNSDTKIAGNKYESFSMSKDGRKITVYSYNVSGNVKTIKECLIGGVECDAYNEVNFVIAKNITVKSTPEEIKNAFGAPGYSNSGDGYESMTYYAQKDSTYNSVKFYCTDDGKYSSISLKNFIETEDDKTETNTKKPDYLAEYKVPSTMGTDLKSPVVKIAGSLYQLPAPVSEFLNNGWKITQQSGDLVAGGTDSIRVEKDGKKLSLSIANLAEYQTTVENCIVYAVYVYDSDNADMFIGSSSKPITCGMTKAEVDASITNEINTDETTYSYTYSYSEYKERDFSVYFSVDKEKNKVESINISCKTWQY